MKWLFKNRFNLFDGICWVIVAAIADFNNSAWWLLLLVPAAVISAICELYYSKDNPFGA